MAIREYFETGQAPPFLVPSGSGQAYRATFADDRQHFLTVATAVATQLVPTSRLNPWGGDVCLTVNFAETDGLVVHIEDAASAPARDLRVLWRFKDQPHWRMSRTDAAGRLAVPFAAHGRPLIMMVAQPGQSGETFVFDRTGSRRGRLAAQTWRAFRLLGPDGQPLTPVAMALGSEGAPLVWRQNENTIEVLLPAGVAQIYAFFANGYSTAFEFPAHAAGALIELRPQLIAPLEGRVLDEDGRPVAGAWIATQNFPRQEVTTDVGGRFRLSLPVQPEALVEIRAKGFAADSFPLETPTSTVDWVLRKAEAQVRGRVVDDGGAPLAEGCLRVCNSPASLLDCRYALSGQDGRFVVPGLLPGPSLELLAEKSGFFPGRQRIQTSASEEIEIELSRAVRLTGQIVHGQQPVPGLNLQLTSGLDFREQTTESDGRFRFEDLKPGKYQLEAQDPGQGYLRLQVAIPKAVAAVDLGALPLGLGNLWQGRVISENEPLAGVRVYRARPTEGYIEDLRSTPKGRPLATTAADGRFEIAADSEAAAPAIELHAEGFLPRRVDPAEWKASEGEFELSAWASLTGKISGGANVERMVTFQSENAAFFPSMTGVATDDRFEIPRLPAGPGELMIEAPGFLSVTQKIALEPGRTKNVEIALEPALELAGKLHAPSGNLEGAELWAECPPVACAGALVTTLVDGKAFGRLQVGSDGSFRLPDVPPGPRRILAYHPRHPRLEATLDVQPGMPLPLLSFSSEAPFSLRGRLEGGGGRKVWLIAHSPSQREWVSETNERGEFLFQDIPGGPYRLRAGDRELDLAIESDLELP